MATNSARKSSGTRREPSLAAASKPVPCLWKGCPLHLWHLGPHLPALLAPAPRVERRPAHSVLVHAEQL